jgi:hypothetical protein
MSLVDRFRTVALSGTLLAVAVGCGAQADDALSAEEASGTATVSAADARPFVPPPAGTTGTPADDVVDPASRNLPNTHPNMVTNWGRLPGGREWGSSAGIDIGPDGHIWAYDRCGGTGFGPGGNCQTNRVDPILKFDRNTGELLTSFGAGLFAVPHGIHVDREGNVWVTDFAADETGTVGQQVIKFSPEGEVLMRLGTAGEAGGGRTHFNQPNDVIVAPNGDIFVADGHSGQGQDIPEDAAGRIVKFSPQGEYIMEWGRVGNGPGEFRTPHAMAFDSQGRLFVADRGNHRIQIFDQQGNHIDSYYQYSRVSDLWITPDDVLYAIDSESTDTSHPNWLNGIRIGSAREDRVTAFIPPHPREGRSSGVAGEGIAVDVNGNIYAAEGPASRPVVDGGITRYSR